MFSVIGPGAVGGLLAAMLERSGALVLLVARSEQAAAIRAHGISVASDLLGSWTSRFPAVAERPSAAPAILAVKAPALPGLLPVLAAADPTELLVLLNGVAHVAQLRAALPRTRVVAATITVEAARNGLVAVEHRSPFVRLAVCAADADRTTVRALSHAGVEVSQYRTENEVLWRKYRFLAPMALLTAIHGLPLGPALARDRRLADAVVAETACVASAAGLPTSAEELWEVLDGLPRAMRSSLQQDMAAGRPDELAQLGGGLLAVARLHALATPAITAVVAELETRRQ